MVANMRNGVLAIDRVGRLVLINDEACRIFGLPPDLDYLGQPYADVFRAPPRHRARARRRLRDGGAAQPRRTAAEADRQGDRLHAVADSRRARRSRSARRCSSRTSPTSSRWRSASGCAIGSPRSGEMAAAMAHEIKNPLAGIEVMAGLLRRQVPDKPDAQSLVERHHQRSQDGQRHRPGDARLRAAGAPAARSRVARRGADERRDHGRRQGSARRDRGRHARRRRRCRRFRAISTSWRRCSPIC